MCEVDCVSVRSFNPFVVSICVHRDMTTMALLCFHPNSQLEMKRSQDASYEYEDTSEIQYFLFFKKIRTLPGQS